MAVSAPVSTVYVQNLEERVKPDTLVESLRALFSEFGNVVDVVAKQNLKAKGQAFVVFDNAQSAQDAVEEIQGFYLFDKPMKVAMARTRSDKTVELNGSAEEVESHKRHRQAEKDKKKAAEAAEEKGNLKRGAGASVDNRPAKTAKGSGLKSTSVATSAVVPDEYLPPNKILFLQNLPEEYDVEALSTIFGRFDGFREVRLVPSRRGIAFVEYDAEQGAINAKENTAGMTLGDKTIKVTYQRQ
ncbi:U1 small nuclear ribonucleoprotein-like protein [Emericellopsis cladophorae]|uniref:U1 small nuclear ribonucleoprotein-like protein n=1 Tax=Emericellopsis cladophorae TaxID=2686198 RepID=A0A9Q0BEE0_9HYPO|nr:U1 small nuclear ribonucleoprotein-like protein [Emericellopsis cladophorae]KAI6781761.1 U1 small nuclear ribonucleoprotein-like protein [Emericellopsis cladophorae]